MYYLYRFIDIEDNIQIRIMTIRGYPSNQEDHYLLFNRTYGYSPGRKDGTIVIKPFNVLKIPAPRPKYVGWDGTVHRCTDTSTFVNFMKSQPLTTDLSKIDITTIFPELFI